MKIEINAEADVVLTEVFSGVTIQTQKGIKLYICLRDEGFDIKVDGGNWNHLDYGNDFVIKPLTTL